MFQAPLCLNTQRCCLDAHKQQFWFHWWDSHVEWLRMTPEMLPTESTSRFCKSSLTGCLIPLDEEFHIVSVTRGNNRPLGTKSTKCKRARNLRHWIYIMKKETHVLWIQRPLGACRMVWKTSFPNKEMRKMVTKTITKRNAATTYASVSFPMPLLLVHRIHTKGWKKNINDINWPCSFSPCSNNK